jgi:hypothetical protein
LTCLWGPSQSVACTSPVLHLTWPTDCCSIYWKRTGTWSGFCRVSEYWMNHYQARVYPSQDRYERVKIPSVSAGLNTSIGWARPGLAWKPRLWPGLRRLWLCQTSGQAKAAIHSLAWPRPRPRLPYVNNNIYITSLRLVLAIDWLVKSLTPYILILYPCHRHPCSGVVRACFHRCCPPCRVLCN